MSFVRFAPLSAVPPGSSKSVRVGLKHIAVFNLEGTLYATEDACAHMKAPLADGRVRGTTLTCQRHGWSYDLRTGERLDKESGSIRTFPVKVEGGMIYVDPAAAEPGAEDLDEPEDDLPPALP